MSLEASLHTSAVRTGGMRGNAVPASLGLSPRSTGDSALSRTLEVNTWKSLVEGTENDFRKAVTY